MPFKKSIVLTFSFLFCFSIIETYGQVSVVTIKKENARWLLLVNGHPFYVLPVGKDTKSSGQYVARTRYSSDLNIFDIIRQVKPYQLIGGKIMFANNGVNSFSIQEGALIVIDGIKIGTDAGVLNSIPVTEIDRVNMYTNPSDVQRFTGMNNAGIVEIITKKGH